MDKMWAGRFEKQLDKTADDFNSSIHFDCRMYKQDIIGSMAHAAMLRRQGIITEAEEAQIQTGLSGILEDIESGALPFNFDAEDIHMFVEAELTKRIGDTGKKLHTARSRNDQVALDFGTAFPNLNYSFSLGLEWKGIGINATFQGAGNQIKNLRYVDGVWGALSDNRNMSQEYYDNCYDTVGANALYPRLSTENVANNAQESTIWYRNVSWFKMRDCELYYRFPAALLQHAKISDAKVFVKGQNLLSFDNIPAMDAENLNTGYPVMKAVTFGLSVVF